MDNLINIESKTSTRLQKRETLHLSIHLVDNCNLNCIGCDNFSPIADKKYHSIQSLHRDFKRIDELANGKIDSISLLGGEPLLHPNLLGILDLAGKYFKGTTLRLVTNGVLLRKQDSSFWKTCKRNEIKVTITKYPINLPFDEIEGIAKIYDTMLEYYRNTGIVLKTMHKIPLNLSGNEDMKNSFELCYKSNTCIMLDDGKIYTCATIPYIKYFNKYFGTDLKICEKDYIDIYRVNNVDEIFEFLCKPMPFCRYCNTKEPVNNIKWCVSKKDITEWM
jgi:MoaA/NifB/PqqE/SkfB family radical SAM enzyme